MNHIGDLMFWIAVAAIVILGVTGGILYKFGTNELGTISFEKLLELKTSRRFWIYSALMIGGFLLFIFGGVNLRNESFAMPWIL